MTMQPDDTQDKSIEQINKEYEELQNKKQTSDVMPGLNINHKLPQEKAQEEQQAKEEKANIIIETLETRLKSYIDSQLAQIPQLINQNIQAAFQQILPQLQQGQQQAPQGDPNQADKINAIAQLAPVLQGLLGQGQAPQGQSQSNIIMDMIVQSYMKRMQMDIDAQFMNTYQQPVPPPHWLREQQPQQSQNENKLNIE